MGSVTTAHGAVGVGANIRIDKDRDFTYSLTGTHNATVRIESSGDAGLSWDLVEEVATTALIAPTTIKHDIILRINRFHSIQDTSSMLTIARRKYPKKIVNNTTHNNSRDGKFLYK
jgi:hypothetical protein